MTFQRRTAQTRRRAGPRLRPAATDRGRRLRSQPGAGGLRGPGLGRRRHRPRRRGRHVSRAAACARGRHGRWRRSRACPIGRVTRFVRNPDRPVSSLAGEDVRPPNRCGARARRLHLHRPSDRRRRNVARLHLRLQLLLDHRDARPELPHLVDRTRDGGHRRRTRPRRARHLPRGRQHHAQRRAVRGALPRHRRGRAERHRLHRAGHDLVDCRGRRRRSRR